jgi:hypothetical protein
VGPDSTLGSFGKACLVHTHLLISGILSVNAPDAINSLGGGGLIFGVILDRDKHGQHRRDFLASGLGGASGAVAELKRLAAASLEPKKIERFVALIEGDAAYMLSRLRRRVRVDPTGLL